MAKHAESMPFINLALSASDSRPLYRQLYEGLRTAILEGHLVSGCRLPATRVLANTLGISRFTVVAAFEQLLAEGFLAGRSGSGTFVSSEIPGMADRAARAAIDEGPAAARQPRLSDRGTLIASTRLTNAAEEGKPRAFRPGQPALDKFPAAIWARIAGRLYRTPADALLTYGAVEGYRPLREAIAMHLRVARAIVCDPEQVIVVSGLQQALDLATRVLLDPGDAAWIEDPCYPGARAAILGAGAIPVPIPVDADGIDVAHGALASPRARLAYVTPSYQYPLGVTMSLSRRLALLEWARVAGAWIVEDDYDSEFRYAGHPLAALAGLGFGDHVIYMGTFSKVLFPALRLGYMVVPPAVVEAFSRARALAGRHTPTFEQAVLAEFIAEGHFARHIRAMRLLYEQRQATLVASARAELDGLLEVAPSAAGMHVVGWLGQAIDDRVVARRAAAAGIELQPLSALTLLFPRRSGVLLGYTALDHAEIRAGVHLLASVLQPD